MTSEEARSFAAEWIDTWNRHDLEGILAHYEEDIVFSSPFAIRLLGVADGTLRGRASLRAYFQRGLAAYPDLHFKLLHVAVGVESVTLIYHSVNGLLAAETMFLDAQGRIRRVLAQYE